MPADSFEEFLQAHPLYGSAYQELFAASRVLGTSAQLVYELHPESLGAVADNILSFVQHAFPADYIDVYISRLKRMAELQERFDANPCPATLGCSSVVGPEVYCLALLLSIVFTNHRFEIMQVLTQFLRELPAGSAGSIASIGCGTGYELKLIADVLPTWNIEGYDTDAGMRARAEQLFAFFQVQKKVDFRLSFPLEAVTPQFEKRYDAIILCEVLEHLPDPARALETLKECLGGRGRIFLTMAINIAQEDHIFLYPDIESCRQQIRQSGLEVVYESITPQTIRFPPANRETGFTKGNYIAVVQKEQGRSDIASNGALGC
jgi:2-polyprenyl-3-methyl-5-hydroxy-6-metoxy-1,4-benzoquinol methylase